MYTLEFTIQRNLKKFFLQSDEVTNLSKCQMLKMWGWVQLYVGLSWQYFNFNDQ